MDLGVARCFSTGSLKAMRLSWCGEDSSSTAMGLPGPWRSYKAYRKPPTLVSDSWDTVSWCGHPRYVRTHGLARKGLFHPIHSSTPIAPGDLDGVRYTLKFFDDGTVEEGPDCWMDTPKCLSRRPWRGYTFFAARAHEDDEGGSEGESMKPGETGQEPMKGSSQQKSSSSASVASDSKGYAKGSILIKGVDALTPVVYAPPVEVSVKINVEGRLVHENESSDGPGEVDQPPLRPQVQSPDAEDASGWEHVAP